MKNYSIIDSESLEENSEDVIDLSSRTSSMDSFLKQELKNLLQSLREEILNERKKEEK